LEEEQDSIGANLLRRDGGGTGSTPRFRMATDGSGAGPDSARAKMAIVESPENAFPPLVVHYAETFVRSGGRRIVSHRHARTLRRKKVRNDQAFVRHWSVKLESSLSMEQRKAPVPSPVVAGVLNASFALPMKFTRRWAWENTWAVWSVWPAC